MKKIYAICAAITLAFATNAQTISTFETLSVPADSFISPATFTDGFFQSGNACFQSIWDTSFGGYWRRGFAPSSKTDKTTADFSNLYSASTGSGFNSATYAIATGTATIKLIGNAASKPAKGFYVTNSTYAYYSMKDGDAFAKQFGGSTGNDPDYFLLTVKGFNGGIAKPDSVNFYLADFRFNDNNQDYILDTWAWVDLQSIGDVDSLTFKLTSSDVGQFGMNTPNFFAIDNFTTTDGVSAIVSLDVMNVNAYPNPVSYGSYLNVSMHDNDNADVQLTDMSGRIVYAEKVTGTNNFSIGTATFSRGTYLLTIRNAAGFGASKVVIE